jgi:hypothetical protein
MRHRMVLATAAAAALLIGWTSPAQAAVTTHSASAFWTLSDARNTQVSLQGNTGPTAGSNDSVFVQVNQNFCDTATNEKVFRTFSSQSSVPDRSFTVFPTLRGALLAASVTVNGTEFRQQNCASPTGQPTFTSLGQSSLFIGVLWTGRGPIYQVQPGIRGRAAVARGFIAGSVTRWLGRSDTAELRETTTGDVSEA